jgi:hypothetical protein
MEKRLFSLIMHIIFFVNLYTMEEALKPSLGPSQSLIKTMQQRIDVLQRHGVVISWTPNSECQSMQPNQEEPMSLLLLNNKNFITMLALGAGLSAGAMELDTIDKAVENGIKRPVRIYQQALGDSDVKNDFDLAKRVISDYRPVHLKAQKLHDGTSKQTSDILLEDDPLENLRKTQNAAKDLVKKIDASNLVAGGTMYPAGRESNINTFRLQVMPVIESLIDNTKIIYDACSQSLSLRMQSNVKEFREELEKARQSSFWGKKNITTSDRDNNTLCTLRNILNDTHRLYLNSSVESALRMQGPRVEVFAPEVSDKLSSDLTNFSLDELKASIRDSSNSIMSTHEEDACELAYMGVSQSINLMLTTSGTNELNNIKAMAQTNAKLIKLRREASVLLEQLPKRSVARRSRLDRMINEIPEKGVDPKTIQTFVGKLPKYKEYIRIITENPSELKNVSDRQLEDSVFLFDSSIVQSKKYDPISIDTLMSVTPEKNALTLSIKEPNIDKKNVEDVQMSVSAQCEIIKNSSLTHELKIVALQNLYWTTYTHAKNNSGTGNTNYSDATQIAQVLRGLGSRPPAIREPKNDEDPKSIIVHPLSLLSGTDKDIKKYRETKNKISVYERTDLLNTILLKSEDQINSYYRWTDIPDQVGNLINPHITKLETAQKKWNHALERSQLEMALKHKKDKILALKKMGTDFSVQATEYETLLARYQSYVEDKEESAKAVQEARDVAFSLTPAGIIFDGFKRVSAQQKAMNDNPNIKKFYDKLHHFQRLLHFGTSLREGLQNNFRNKLRLFKGTLENVDFKISAAGLSLPKDPTVDTLLGDVTRLYKPLEEIYPGKFFPSDVPEMQEYNALMKRIPAQVEEIKKIQKNFLIRRVDLFCSSIANTIQGRMAVDGFTPEGRRDEIMDRACENKIINQGQRSLPAIITVIQKAANELSPRDYHKEKWSQIVSKLEEKQNNLTDMEAECLDHVSEVLTSRTNLLEETFPQNERPSQKPWYTKIFTWSWWGFGIRQIGSTQNPAVSISTTTKQPALKPATNKGWLPSFLRWW